jgi:capsular exopolysaccharide synthesis family protein
MPAVRRLTGNRHRSESTYDLASFDRPLLKEAYHQLRTSLMLSSPGGPAQTILITSAQPAEGKSITAYNIAKSLSELGKRVLIIDADLRFPRLHTIANVVNRTGLSTLLTTSEIKREIIAHAIQRQDESNLYVMTAGPATPNPANLLSSNEMSTLLAKLAEQFAYIIIDSPPALYFADSLILANYTNGVVLIARDNKSSLNEILRTKKILGEVRARILGLVINDVPANGYKYYKSDYYDQFDTPALESEASVLHLGG